MKPALSDKRQSNNMIVLVECDEFISDYIEVAEIFNRFFVTVTEALGMKENNDNISGTEDTLDSIEKSVKKYSNHPSILRIKSHFMNVDSFTFNLVSLEEWKLKLKGSIPRRPKPSRVYRQRFLRIVLIYGPNLYWKYLIIALEALLFLMS